MDPSLTTDSVLAEHDPGLPGSAGAAQTIPIGGKARLRAFGAVTLGHFAIDIFNSMGPVLLTFLRTPLGLSAGQVGLGIGLYQFLAGSTQPVFGWVADRLGSRFIGPLSVLCTLSSVSLAVFLALRTGHFVTFLLVFALAAIGSGAFHPQGTMHAGAAIPGRAATTTAIFFLCGQAGLASGPVLAGVALDSLGPVGIYLLAMVLSVVPLYMLLAMRSVRAERVEAHERREPILLGSLEPKVLSLLAAIFGLRGWVFIGTASFLPLLFQGQGWSSTWQGVATGLFWMGGGIGGVVAGGLADRFGRRLLVALTTFTGAVLLFFLPGASGVLSFVLAAGCGAFLGAPHSILIVLCQDLLPVRRGLSAGVALGFLFAMGAMGAWGIGLLADVFRLQPVLQAGTGLGVLAATLSLLLPGTSDARAHELS